MVLNTVVDTYFEKIETLANLSCTYMTKKPHCLHLWFWRKNFLNSFNTGEQYTVIAASTIAERNDLDFSWVEID